MKKFLAFFLAIMVLFSMASMFTTVGATGFDANDIAYIDYLDFSEKNNKWNERDTEGNLIHTGFTDDTLVDENGKTKAETGTAGKYYPFALHLENDNFNKNLNHEFKQNGEVLRLTATSTDNPGIAFDFSKFSMYKIGSQNSNAAEYVKIRFKNNSPSTKLTLVGTHDAFGAGALNSRIRATIDIEPNSSEWQTLTISMVDAVFNTTGTYNWGSTLKKLAICPFGYGSDNESIVNDKYYMDIDYVVIGSYEYVTAYQSNLETKENAAVEFEFASQPTKTEYYLGQTVDLSGLQANIKYGQDKNGTPLYPNETVGGEGVSAVYNFDKPLDEDGNPIDADSWETTVTITYGALMLEYDVTVYDIKEIQFDYLNDKNYETAIENKVYDRVTILRNGRFLPEDLQVKVIYSKLVGGVNDFEIKTMQEVDLIGTEFAEAVELSEGGYYEYLVTINYHGHVLYLPVKIIEIAELVVTPVADKAATIYYGTPVDASFFEVVCKYTNGEEKALADTGLDSYLSVACNTKTTGGDTTATLNLLNPAYEVDVVKDVTVKVQTPKDITVKLKSSKYDVDEAITPNRFTVVYTYEDGETATVDQDDPNLVFNYDTSAPGENLTGVVKIGDKKATFKFTVNDAEFDENTVLLNEAVKANRNGVKVKLLAPKFPTFWLVTIIVAAVIAFFVGLWAVLKFGFKVDFKRKKRVSLDDIF